MEKFFDHSHITKHIVSLSSLVAVGGEEVEEEAKETDTDVDKVVPECTREPCDLPEGVRVDGAPCERVLEEDGEEGEGPLDREEDPDEKTAHVVGGLGTDKLKT